MDADERERYWQDYRVIGRHFGLADADLPATWADFRAYVDGMVASGDLVVTPRARELGLEIVMRPPVPRAPAARCWSSRTSSRSGCCRAGVRRQYGFSWDPARALALRGGAEYAQARRRAAAAAGRALRAQRAPAAGGLTPHRTASAPGPQAAQPAPGDARDGQRVLAQARSRSASRADRRPATPRTARASAPS